MMHYREFETSFCEKFKQINGYSVRDGWDAKLLHALWIFYCVINIDRNTTIEHKLALEWKKTKKGNWKSEAFVPWSAENGGIVKYKVIQKDGRWHKYRKLPKSDVYEKYDITFSTAEDAMSEKPFVHGKLRE